MNNFDKEFSFEIVEHIGVIFRYPTGWRKELNLVSWNGADAKYDIRDWSPDHEHMSRGITFHAKEARKVCRLLEEHFANDEIPEE